ncbi:DUF2798 domain-containing protein [soil metagenome]
MKQRVAFALMMGVVTTCIISFSLVAINIGFVPSFIRLWLKSWVIAYVIVIPAILIISPLVQKLVEHLIPSKNTPK